MGLNVWSCPHEFEMANYHYEPQKVRPVCTSVCLSVYLSFLHAGSPRTRISSQPISENRQCHNHILLTNPANVKVKLIFLPDNRNYITIIMSKQNLILNRLHKSRYTSLSQTKMM